MGARGGVKVTSIDYKNFQDSSLEAPPLGYRSRGKMMDSGRGNDPGWISLVDRSLWFVVVVCNLIWWLV